MERRFYVEWLPADVASEAREEPARFRALTQALRGLIDRTDPATPDAWAPVLQYVPCFNNLLDTRQVFATEDVVALVQALLQVVCRSSDDTEVQVRCADLANKALQRHKRVLSRGMHSDEEGGSDREYTAPRLTIAWRPLFDLLVALYGDPAPAVHGVGSSMSRSSSLVQLVTRCRRYFEPAAAIELWEALRPGIAAAPHALSAAFDALGWLCLFTPTNALGRCGSEAANRLLHEWMAAWGWLAACPSWDAMWAGLLARTAKHDWLGLLDWSPHLPKLFTHMVAAFDLPVGSTTNPPPFLRSAPNRSSLLYSSKGDSLPESLARVALHLLRSVPSRPETVTRAADVATRLAQMAALLDSYFHPSNTGRWSKDLAAWLHSLVGEFSYQLGKQGPEPWASFLGQASQDAFVDITLQLSARAQFSKDNNLRNTATHTLAALAWVQPAKALPLVVQRFRAALENSTATRQLSAAIWTLALCVRPMLVSGWGLEDETGPQLLAEAIVALLPGIDANDEAKTGAVINLLVAVLSTAPAIGSDPDLDPGMPEAAVRIPVYVEDWADELVTRLTSLLANSDSGPGHRSTDAAAGSAAGDGQASGGSGLNQPDVPFDHLIELLLTRLPPSVAAAVAERFARFAASEVLPGVASEVGQIVLNVADKHAAIAVATLVRPVMQRVIEELESCGVGAGEKTAGARPSPQLELSASTQAMVVYQLRLLSEAVTALPWTALEPLAQDVQRCIDLTLQVESRPVQAHGCKLLEALCVAALGGTISGPQFTLAPLGRGGALLLDWVDREGNGAELPSHTAPAPSGIALAERLLSRHVLQTSEALLASLQAGGGGDDVAAAAGGHQARLRRHALILQMKGVVMGLGARLPDFNIRSSTGAPGADASVEATPAHVAGPAGPWIGQPGTRELLAARLTQALRLLYSHHDVEALRELVVLLEVVACAGSMEWLRTAQHSGDHIIASGPTVAEEPAMAGLLINANRRDAGLAAAAAVPRPWRKRISVMSAINQALTWLMWRASQRAFRSWATVGAPAVASMAQLPPELLDLLQQLCRMATHPLRAVRSEAAAVLGPCLTRYGVAAPLLLSHTFCALAGVSSTAVGGPVAVQPSPGHAAAAGLGAPAAPGDALLAALLTSAFAGVEPPPGVVLRALPPEALATAMTQGEQDALVEGATLALAKSLPCWRLVTRDPAWHEALIYALLASRSHNSSVAQAHIGMLFLHVLSRLKPPPGVQYDSPGYGRLAERLLHLAHPDTLRGSWRYCLAANVLAVLMAPPASAGPPCLPFIHHFLHALLRPGSPLQLAMLGLSGLTQALVQLVEYGQPNEPLVAEVRGWLALPSAADALPDALLADHQVLEGVEAGADARGGGAAAAFARRMNATNEEYLMRMVGPTQARSVAWPEHGNPEWAPEGVQQGLFVVRHAHLVHLLATLAPAGTAAAVQPLLTKAAEAAVAQEVVNTSDKALQATAAECTAGLLAAGLGVAPTADAAPGAPTAWILQMTAQQLRVCTLEMSEAWAIALRYGVYGLMQVGHPPFDLYVHVTLTAGPTAGRPGLAQRSSLTPAAALDALRVLLDLARAAGPALASAPRSGTATPEPQGPSAAPAATGHAAVLKWGRYNHQCARELLSCDPHASPPQAVLQFWHSLAEDMRGALRGDVFSLRAQLGKTIGLLIMQLLAAPRWSSSKGGAPGVDMEVVEAPGAGAGRGPSVTLDRVRLQVQGLRDDLLASFVAGCDVVQQIRHTASVDAGVRSDSPAQRAAAAKDGSSGGSSGGGSASGVVGPSTAAPAPVSAPPSVATDSDLVVLDRPVSPWTLPDEGDSGRDGSPASPGPAPWAVTQPKPKCARLGDAPLAVPVMTWLAADTVSVALSRVGLGLGVIIWAAINGDLNELAGLLQACLPRVLRLQELSGPVLQKLSHEALAAMILSKHAITAVVGDERSWGQVVECLESAAEESGPPGAGLDTWSTRGAAMSWAQYFWFRTCFLLPQPLATRLRATVLARLADPKLEVRQVAGASLSGMLRGMPVEAAQQLRSDLLARAQRVLVPIRRRTTAAPQAQPLAPTQDLAPAQLTLERHAVVQGLASFLLSSPYDSPPWMPDVLLALVRPASAQHGANLEAAVRSAAAKALSEFKRTHEEDSLAELRGMMSEEGWDSLQQATHSASYFS